MAQQLASKWDHQGGILIGYKGCSVIDRAGDQTFFRRCHKPDADGDDHLVKVSEEQYKDDDLLAAAGWQQVSIGRWLCPAHSKDAG